MKLKSLPNVLPSRARKSSITGIVVHATAGASALSSFEWLKKIGLGYHFIIERNGTVYACVPKERIAFHAGKSLGWDGPNCNEYTIGIAFANRDDAIDPITNLQLQALAELVAELKRKVTTIEFISTHKRVSPGRKTDPVLWTPHDVYQGLKVYP